MKSLLVVSALTEVPTGVALLVSPSWASSLLLGVPLDAAASLVLGRVCGAGLLALGIACGLAGTSASRGAVRALVVAMLVYDLAAAATLAHARIGLSLSSVLLWPVIAFHAALAVWCFACLLRRPRNPADHDATHG